MKYIIKEEQYQEYRKSTIKRFLRRVSHRLDGILYDTIQHVLQYFPMKDLIHMGEEGFAVRVVGETFEYIYESYIEEDVTFKKEQQDIIRDYIYNRYYKDIRDEYLIHLNKSNINEEKLPRPLLRRMEEIENALKSVIKLYDIDEYNRTDFIDEVLHSIYDNIDYNDVNEFFEYIGPMYVEKIGKIYDRKSKIRNSRRY